MSDQYNQRSFLIHPSGMILILILCGVTALFGALSIAYIYTRVDRGMTTIHVPLLFIFNSVLLLLASYHIHQCKKYFLQRNDKKCLHAGIKTILFTIVFLAMQVIAWNQLLTKSEIPATSPAHGYLYAISILHFFHVLAGIPFLISLMAPLWKSIQDDSAAIYFLEDARYRRLKYTAWYWHFIDAVWIYLILFFLFNHFI